jgi:diadenosine tetraphosphate (Ap4A) HIT family hydrolase
MNNKCLFCNHCEFINRTIFESKFFIFILDQHQVNDYHFLLVSKRHVTSFGYLSIEELLEAETIINNLQKNKSFKNKYITAFERGNKNENKSTNFSIDHAHIHLFILTQSLSKKFTLGEKFKNTTLLNLIDYIKSKSYFVFWEVRNFHWKIGNADDLPSQHIRRFITEQTEINKNWDWKINPSLKMNLQIKSLMVDVLICDSNFKQFHFYLE